MTKNDDLYSQPLGNLKWRKSTFSNPHNCVEVAELVDGRGYALRDSKNPGHSALIFTPGEWDAFVKGAAAGEF